MMRSAALGLVVLVVQLHLLAQWVLWCIIFIRCSSGSKAPGHLKLHSVTLGPLMVKKIIKNKTTCMFLLCLSSAQMNVARGTEINISSEQVHTVS